MARKEMTQSEINAILNDSDFESSAVKDSQLQSRVIEQPPQQAQKPNYEESNEYGNEDFQDFEQSKRTNQFNAKNAPKPTFSKAEISYGYDSYANEEFNSYEQSKRTKEFQKSQAEAKFTKKNQAKQLKPIEEHEVKETMYKKKDDKIKTTKFPTTKSPGTSQPSFHKPKNNNIIIASKEAPKQKPKTPLITTTDIK